MVIPLLFIGRVYFLMDAMGSGSPLLGYGKFSKKKMDRMWVESGPVDCLQVLR